MLVFLIIFGLSGIVTFQQYPGVVYMFIWYTLIVTIFFIVERFESRKK